MPIIEIFVQLDQCWLPTKVIYQTHNNDNAVITETSINV